MLSLGEITKELFYEKTRIILTIFAIAWGTFTIAIMLAMGEGLRLNFARTMANAGNKLLTITPGVTSKNYRGTHANQPIKFMRSDVQVIAKLPNVESATPQYGFASQIRYKDHEIDASFQGVTQEFASIHQIEVGAGQRFISAADLKRRNFVVVVGSMAAETLFDQGENPVGKILYLGNHPFVIIGVMQKKSQMWTSETPDARLNWIPATTYELLTNAQEIGTIAVAYKDLKLLPETQASIQQLIALKRGLDPNDASIVNFSELAKNQEEVNKFFVGMQIFLGIVGSLTLLIAGVGIANVMYASVVRATQQIGVKMALGATTKHILTHYIFESLVATALGGIIGIIATIFVAALIRLIPMQGKMIDAIGKPEPVLSSLVLVIVIIVLGITGFVAGLFPALKAAKVDPADALIYE